MTKINKARTLPDRTFPEENPMPADTRTEAQRHMAAADQLGIAVIAIGRAMAHEAGLDWEDVLCQLMADVKHLQEGLKHCAAEA